MRLIRRLRPHIIAIMLLSALTAGAVRGLEVAEKRLDAIAYLYGAHSDLPWYARLRRAIREAPALQRGRDEA
jgi:hypothetical protein